MTKYAWPIVCLAVIFSACSKNKDHHPQPPAAVSVKIKAINPGPNQSDYTYNGDGSLDKITRNGLPEYEYVYAPGKVTSFRYKTDGSLMEKVNMTLDGNGLVTEYQNEAYPTVLIKYEYNPDGNVKTKMNYDNGILSTITRYTYQGGNLVKDSTYSAGGAPNYSRTYEYFTGIVSTIEYPNYGQAFWGNGNKNPLKKITYINDGTGAVSGIQVFAQPETDGTGRITKTSYQNNGSGSPLEKIYTYY